MTPTRFVIDVDSDLDFLDRPDALYAGGKTFSEMIAAKGYPNDPAAFAAALGRPLPSVPRVEQ